MWTCIVIGRDIQEREMLRALTIELDRSGNKKWGCLVRWCVPSAAVLLNEDIMCNYHVE